METSYVETQTQIDHPPHPYYPLDIEVTGWERNTWQMASLLSVFFGAVALVLIATYTVAKRYRPHLPLSELLTIMWFVICGCIHTFFEGFYVFNWAQMGGAQHPIGQMWKEYAFSDSRYLTQDPAVWCLEAITVACWGPLSFTVAHMITTEDRLRHPLTILLSMGQLYGDVLYYVTSLYDKYFLGISYSRPEPFYFWFYFVGMNAFWIVVPAILIYQSVATIAKAMGSLERTKGILKERGLQDEMTAMRDGRKAEAEAKKDA